MTAGTCNDNGKDKKQIPPLRCGMTTKRPAREDAATT
jgi:hypothetical protein